MDYVEGHDLSSVLAWRGPLPIGEACEFVRQAALGLQHAFEQGMVHRDIKPGNLLVHQPPGQVPVIKVLDMGLARFTSETTEGGALTQAGQVVGTPDYMAPEQAVDSHTADIRADIFSLGCTLFRLLTGQVPWPDGGVVQRLMARRVQDAPLIRTIRSDVPPELESAIARMLKRQPAERFQTPAEVAQALAPFAVANTDDAFGQGPRSSVATAAPTRNETSLLETTPIQPDSVTSNFLQSLASEATFAASPEAIDDTTHKSALATIVSGDSSPLKARLERQKTADRQRMWIGGCVALLVVAVIGGWLLWSARQQTRIVVDWDEADRQGASLEVDGLRQIMPATGELVFTGEPGNRIIRMMRPDFEPLTRTVTLKPGDSVVIRPQWRPTPETARRNEFQQLRSQVRATLAANADDAQLSQWRDVIFAFQAAHLGTTESLQAATLLRRLPSFADRLQQSDITRYELDIAAGADQEPPEELVAVIGDSRLRHAGHMSHPTFSPDGSQLITAGNDRVLHCWNPQTGQLIRTVMGPTDVQSMAFSADGKFAIGSHALLIFDGFDGKLLQTIDTGAGHVSLKFDSTGKTIAFHDERGLRFADVETGEVNLDEPAWEAAFDPQGNQIALVDKTMGIVRDRDSGEIVCEFEFPESNGTNLRWSPDGRLLALIGTHISGTMLFDARTGELFRDIPWREESRVEFHPDSTLIAITDHSGSGCLRDVATDEIVHTWGGGIISLAFSPDGETLATGTWYGSIQFRDARTGQIKLPQPPTATSVTVRPDGGLIATGHTDGSIRLTDLTTGKSGVTQTVQWLAPVKHRITTWSVAFAPAGHWLASAGADSKIHLQNVSNRDSIGPLDGQGAHHITSVAISGDGRVVAWAGNDATICVRNLETPDVTTSLISDVGMDHMSSLTLNTHGTLIGVADREGRLAVWDVKSKQKMDTQSGYAIAFSPDGRLYVTGSADGTVSLWDAKTRKHKKFVVKHPQSVRAVAFSADGGTLASASSDGQIRLATIDVSDVQRDPREIQFGPHVGNIRQVVFTPDARHLVTANQNGTVFVLRLETR